MTQEQLMALPTLSVDGAWHMKVNNRQGRVWVDPTDGYTITQVWRDGGLHTYDPDGKSYPLTAVMGETSAVQQV